MKIVVVGKRDGKAVIHWRGVALCVVIVMAATSLGFAAMSFTLGWYSPKALLFVLPMAIGGVLGQAIIRGKQTPLDQLQPLP